MQLLYTLQPRLQTIRPCSATRVLNKRLNLRLRSNMPRVRVSSPTPAEISKHSREFSLFMQLANGNEIDTEALMDMANHQGLGDAAQAQAIAQQSGSDVKFSDVAGALHKQGQAVEGSGNCLGWGAADKSGKLAPWRFDRRPVGPKDVSIQISHVGMCHSDVHTIKSEWGETKTRPIVPGHEIVGIVTQVGSDVTKFKVGQRAGVGCMSNSCSKCSLCAKGEENYCPQVVWTYNSVDADGSITQGGYSSHIVVVENFVLHLPESLPLAGMAPLLCAGITLYSPLVHYGLNRPGLKIAINGLGGLGHMGVKLAKAMGAEVTVLSRSMSKAEDAKRLGADYYVATSDAEAMKKLARTYDGIIDTVSSAHDMAALFNILNIDGSLVMVGLPEGKLDIPHTTIVQRRLKFGGSCIGGIQETQDMLDFCAKHNITADVEVIEASYVSEAVERMIRGDVKFRFVIDVQRSIIA